jgi:hypothetical protein
MWPAIQALTATLMMTAYRSPPVCARESGTPARTRASSGLSSGGIGACPTPFSLLLSSYDATLCASRSAVTEASKYRQAERTWILSRSETVVICFSIVSSTVAGARVTPRRASSVSVWANGFLERLGVPHERIVGGREQPPDGFTCIAPVQVTDESKRRWAGHRVHDHPTPADTRASPGPITVL